MIKTLDMKTLRHLSLFNKVTRIDTRFSFMYNETLFFCVPRQLISKAIGEGARNIRRISEVVKRKIKIIPMPNSIEHIKPFIETIVSPITFKELEVRGDEVILTAGSQSKAALLGRNKRRLLEMQGIVGDFFNKEFKIV